MNPLLRSTSRGHRGLYLFAVAMAALSAVLLIAALLDDRTLLGANVWIKPLKFSISFALYAGAVSWLLSRLDRLSRPADIAGWVIVIASATEVAIITFQAARGVRSHFNEGSALDGALFALMGMTIALLYLAAVGIAFAVLRRGGPDLLVTRAVKAGLVISLAGMAIGMIMIANGAHAVGVPDGGPGLAFTGWSTTGGDLRIGHFIGMHALQLLPLAAAAISTRRSLPVAVQLRLLDVVICGYVGVVALVTWQALRGQPLLSPDFFTLVAAVGLLVAVAAGGRWALNAGSRDRFVRIL